MPKLLPYLRHLLLNFELPQNITTSILTTTGGTVNMPPRKRKVVEDAGGGDSKIPSYSKLQTTAANVVTEAEAFG